MADGKFYRRQVFFFFIYFFLFLYFQFFFFRTRILFVKTIPILGSDDESTRIGQQFQIPIFFEIAFEFGNMRLSKLFQQQYIRGVRTLLQTQSEARCQIVEIN